MPDNDVNPAADAGSDSVRDAVVAAFKEHDQPTEQTFELPAAPGDSAAEPREGETEQQKADRARNERGQFAKADDAPKKPAAPAADKITDPDSIAKAPAQASAPAGEPPKGWSAEARAEWSKLSPATQTAVLKREQEIQDGGRQWSEEKRRYEEMISPLREQSGRRGINEAEGLKRLLAAQNALDGNPAHAIRWLAKSYGVDLQQLATNPGYQAQPVAPRVQQPDIGSVIEQKLEEREAVRTVQSMAKDTEKFPHFEKVRNVMAALIESGSAETPEDAYEQATMANKETREQILAAQQSSAAEEKRRAEQERVEKARRAAVSLRGSPSGSPAPQSKEFSDVRSAVEDAWRRHSA